MDNNDLNDLIEVAARLSRLFNESWTTEQAAAWLKRRNETAAHYLEQNNRLSAELRSYTEQPPPADPDTDYEYQKFLDDSAAWAAYKYDK